MGFTNKVCVVTGGALGIGRCMTQEFAKLGAKVAFVDMNEAAGKENLELIQKAGGEAFFFHGNIGEEQVLRDFVQEVVSVYGSVDYLINNACLTRGGILNKCRYDLFNYVLQVGVTAPYFLTLLFLPHFNPEQALLTSLPRGPSNLNQILKATRQQKGYTCLTHALAASLAGKVG